MKIKLYFISGLAFFLVVPLYAVEQSSYENNYINNYRYKSPTIYAGSNTTVNINYVFINKGEYKQGLEIREKHFVEKLNNHHQNNSQRNILENKLRTVRDKLINLTNNYQKEKNHSQGADQALSNFTQYLPQAEINKARASLSSGNTEVAGNIFDEIVRKGSGPIALAAFHSGQLAEDRIDYAKAMKQYTTAVALENHNLEYLLAAGIMAKTTANYPQAQKWLEHLLQIRQTENKWGVDLAIAQHNLASLYQAQGKVAKAEPLYLRALGIEEKALGKNHPYVANTLSYLASLYQTQGKYAKAESLYLRALGIKEKALGKNHPHLATTLFNLASLYQAQGKYAKAESLYLRALGIYEKALGKNHPHVATALVNLASLYQAQGKYAKAESLYLRALAESLYLRALGIEEKALGKNHPEVATALVNLASLYQTQGKYAKAESLYLRALGIYEKALGKNHPHVATTLFNLASLYQAQGKVAKAKSLYLRALEIEEKTLGKNHPEVATTLFNLAKLYQAQGKYAKAESLYLRALSVLKVAFPNGHPDIDKVQGYYNNLKAKMK